MSIQYDVFHPTGDGTRVSPPYIVTVLKSDGTLVTRNIKTYDDLRSLKPYAAYKIHKPENPIEALVKKLWGESLGSSYDLKRILNRVNELGFLKVDGQPSSRKTDWLDEKLDQLGITYPSTRSNIRNWFENPEKYPEVNVELKNQILTVKRVTGGRVVVLPTGHTISYSKAQQIYSEMCGNYQALNRSSVTVGEFANRYITHRKYALTIRYSGATVGCQTVPRQAIMELAEREGW